MDHITVLAASEQQALQTAVQRYDVTADLIQCSAPAEPAEPVAPPSGPAPAEGHPEHGGPPPPLIIGDGPLTFHVRVKPQFWEQQARAWVQGLMRCFGLLAEVRVQTIGTQVFVRLSCPEPSILIGRQGYTLEALQHIVTRALTTRWTEFPEVVVDVESYKENKLHRLEHMARRAAERALQLGRPQDLEPMTASERKYIHNALKDITAVRTISHGREPFRHVVIEPLDPTPQPNIRLVRPDPGSRGNRDRRDDRGPHRRYGHHRDRPPMRGPYPPAASSPTHPGASTTDTDDAHDAHNAHDKQHDEADESLHWRPTFFKPPDQATADPNQPYPDVEDDLHS